MSHTRPAITSVSVFLLALSGAQCAGDGGRAEADSSTLTIHVADGDERSMGPLGLNWFLVFLGLAVDVDDSGDPQPRLMDRWEDTSDYTEWTMHLREDVRWNDGVPVTAEDVKFSLDMWTHTDILYENRWFEQVTVVDEHTLRMTFKEPVSNTIFTFNWLAMLPKHRLETLDLDQIFSWPFWVEPVGNGPFRYVRHVPSTMTELEVNPDYYGEAPKIPRVVLRYGGSGVVELLSGNADVVSGLTPLEAMQLTADPRFQVYHRVLYTQDMAIVWNQRVPLFRDAAVRRALTMSIDRNELHRLLDYPEDLPVYDVPALARHHQQGVVPSPLAFDREQAAQVFASAGWRDSDGDEILDRDGQEFRFTLSVTQTQSTEATYIQDQLRRAGMRMDIAIYDRNALRERTDRAYDFEAAIAQYNFLTGFREFRRSGYQNPEATRLHDAARFNIDPDDVAIHLRALWKIFQADMPVTYLHPRIEYLAAHRRVKGMKNNRELFSLVEHLWLEEASRPAGL